MMNHKNAHVRAQSTSGGAFSAIAELVLTRSQAAVYGASYQEDWTVHHQAVHSPGELNSLRQSKYAQSMLGKLYKEIDEHLSRGETVVFSGTPCQVDALRLFLGRSCDRLVLVDVVCHGVSSAALFQRYVRALEGSARSKATMFRFRDKVTKRSMASLAHTTVHFANGKVRSTDCDLFLRAYMAGSLHRASCEKCPYAGLHHRSDITLGDFWGIEEQVPGLRGEAQSGISLLLANTRKGRDLIAGLAEIMVLEETDLSIALNGKNRQLHEAVSHSGNAEAVYSGLNADRVQLKLLKAIGLRALARMGVCALRNRVKSHIPEVVWAELRRLCKRSEHCAARDRKTVVE